MDFRSFDNGCKQLYEKISMQEYQIKADHAGSNMVANILLTDTRLIQGVGSKGQTISFLKV